MKFAIAIIVASLRTSSAIPCDSPANAEFISAAASSTTIILVVSIALGVRVHTAVLGVIVVLLAAALMNSAFAGLSQGIALLVRKEATMIAIANFIGLPLFFLSSTLISIRQIPHWMQIAAKFNPVNWGVIAAREVVLPGTDWNSVGLHLALLFALSVATAAFATWTFRATKGRSKASGVGSIAAGVRRPWREATTASRSASQATPWQGTIWALILVLGDHAHDLAGRDGLARLDGQLGDDAVAVGRDLVLHLHRLDDADHLAGANLVAVGHFDSQHGALHRRHDRVLGGSVVRAAAGSLPAAPRQLREGRLRDQGLHLVEAPVELDARDAFSKPAVRRGR